MAENPGSQRAWDRGGLHDEIMRNIPSTLPGGFTRGSPEMELEFGMKHFMIINLSSIRLNETVNNFAVSS
jgi:hypothetical protein